MNNPSLRSMPRDQKAAPFPRNTDGSILGWLEQSGRFMDREVFIDPALLEENELSTELMGGDDYGDDDDDLTDDQED